jgi:DNA-binding NarL/FixJ family response regulator
MKAELLSEREQEVMKLIVTGALEAQIAEELHCSAHTVDNHIRRIYRKLQVHCRAQAAFAWGVHVTTNSSQARTRAG